MSPMQNGYTIYVGGKRRDWIVRVYRDSDDQHIHSAESCYSIRLGLDEAHRAIVHDIDKSSAALAADRGASRSSVASSDPVRTSGPLSSSAVSSPEDGESTTADTPPGFGEAPSGGPGATTSRSGA